MFKSLIILIMLLTNTMFLFMKHPLSMGFCLLVQTISTCIMTGMLSINFWFSYILFLIMIGGMLILFLYMTSIASNKKFKFSMNLMFFMIIMNMVFILLIKKFNLIENNNDSLIKIDSMNKILINYLNYPNNLIFYLTIIYLLISLIVIVKLIICNKSPIRQKF